MLKSVPQNFGFSGQSVFRPRAITAAALLGVLASPLGCGSGEPEVALSESEAVERQDGTSLNSAYADPTKTYISKRRWTTLEKIGALQGEALKLAKRVDGIIANEPANGYLSTAELLQMEQPGFIELLFASEKAELPQLWGTLETTAEAPAYLTLSPTWPHDFKEAFVEPGANLPDPTPYPIAELPDANWRGISNRIQLAFDEDNAATTVSIADLDAAIAAPGPYLPNELEWLKAIRQHILSSRQSPLQARLLVPEPSTWINHGAFSEYRKNTYKLEGGIPRSPRDNYYNYGSEIGISVSASAGDYLVWICQSGKTKTADEGWHYVSSQQEFYNKVAAQHLSFAANGLCVIEKWRSGVRLFVHAFTRDSKHSRIFGPDAVLKNHAGFDLITPSGKLINYGEEHFTNKTGLPAGRYRFSDPSGVLDLAIDVFPQAVIRIKDMRPQNESVDALFSHGRSREGYWENQLIGFTPEIQEKYIWPRTFWNLDGSANNGKTGMWFWVNGRDIHVCGGPAPYNATYPASCSLVTRLDPSMRTG